MGGKNSDDHAIHAAHKRSMKLKVIGALLLCFAVYFFLVVPNVIFDHLRESVGQSAGLVAKFVGASALSPLLAFVLFASDSAFKGGSKGAAWVRSLYPNGIAIERLRCTQKEASTIWFRYFDTWALPGSPNRTILENNYSATYSARMIYYLVRSCIFLSALSGATVLGHCFVFGTYGEVPLRSAWLFVHIGVTCSYAIAAILLVLTNKTGVGSRQATGCWARVEDIFGRSRVLFLEEVLRHANDVPGALARIEAIRNALMTASPPPRQ